MSASHQVVDNGGSGRFASSRGGLCADDTLFVRGCLARSIPSAHIAKMMDRPRAQIERLIALITPEVIQPSPPAFSEPQCPHGDKVVLSLFKGNLVISRSVRSILDGVASEWAMTTEDLVGQSRARLVCWARQEAMTRLFDTGKHSKAAIGRILGNRDHTTVLHGISAHRDRASQSLNEEHSHAR